MTKKSAKKRVLDVGCGNRPYKPEPDEEVVTLDKAPLPHVDVVHDIEQIPWPFPTNYFDKIIARHVLEHIRELPKVMCEMHRVLKPRGKVYIFVPHFSQPEAYTDPTHVRFFGYRTFYYWDPTSPLYHSMGHEVSGPKFRVREVKFAFFGKRGSIKLIELIANRWKNLYEYTLCKLFPPSELRVILEKI